MFPKVGDIVRLNHDFLKVWFKRGNKYLKEVCKEKFTVTEIRKISKNGFLIHFKYKNLIHFKYKNYDLRILSSGESSICSDEYRGIQVFIPANISETKKDNIYCSCGGPKKENWVFGEKFYICTICKKEII